MARPRRKNPAAMGEREREKNQLRLIQNNMKKIRKLYSSQISFLKKFYKYISAIYLNIYSSSVTQVSTSMDGMVERLLSN